MGLEDRLLVGVVLLGERVVVPAAAVELDDEALLFEEQVGADVAAVGEQPGV